MYTLLIIFIFAWFLLLLSSYMFIYALRNLINHYVRRIKDGKYTTGRVEDKVTTPLSFFVVKKHYIVVNQHKYYLSVDEYESVDIGNEYIYILSDRKHEILKVVKNINLYEREVTMKDVIKDSKIYKKLKTSN